MARDLNKVQLTGHLGADAAMRYTAHGSAILTFRVASNRSWRTAAGTSREDTEWFRVVAWDQLAVQCHGQLVRGAHVYVEGRLQTRQWADAGGQPRLTAEVVASEVIILSPTSSATHPVSHPSGRTRNLRQSTQARPAALPPEPVDPSPAPRVRLTEEELPL